MAQVHLWPAEGRDLVFLHAMRKMLMFLFLKCLETVHSYYPGGAWGCRQQRRCPAGAPQSCRCLWLPPLRVLGPQGGAPIAHFQARWLRCSVSCILKRGNGCPGILQGQDKATAECNFCWKMCFAYNCNRHHLWLLIRTNSLLVLWDLSVWFPWHMLHLATLSLNFSLLLCSIVN